MQTIKDILEIIYFISGPVIACVAFKALEQINEAKKQVEEARASRIIGTKREGYKIAADKCDYFMTVIIPLINNLDTQVKSNKITFFEKSQVEITADKIKISPCFQNDEERKKVFNLPNLDLLNPLESFSLFFTSGVADENVGYLTIGKTYCTTVKKYLPLIAGLSNEKYFLNILKLFKIWNNRIEKENLEKEKQVIENKLDKNENYSVKLIGID